MIKAPERRQGQHAAKVVLEWAFYEGERERANQKRGLHFAWLFGPMPPEPKVVRAWAVDLADMLWKLSWPASPAFAQTPLGQAVASGDREQLHPHADALQAAGEPLGEALSWYARELGDPIAVAYEVFQRVKRS